MNAAGEQIGCAELKARVFAYIDDELTSADCERIRAHLERCPGCEEEYQRDVVLKELLRRSCACRAPASLRVSILTRITSITVTTRVTEP